jgi:nicotinate-nucleotide pyrophosphorylase (carboxylating)
MQLNSAEVERIIRAALAEDIGTGDATTLLLVPASATATLEFIPREPLVMCNGGVVERVFAALDASVQATQHAPDGTLAGKGVSIMTVSGPAQPLLTGERVALNLLQRMCAVATLSARYVEAVKGTSAVILDTRKTMPGLRALDKFAVRTAGAQNHRTGLYDAILIKDNHIALCGSVKAALKHAKQCNHAGLPIEIECDTLAQMEEALAAGATRILLDNMDNTTLREAVRLNNGRAALEASGNVHLDTVRGIAETGVDFISVGRLTHSAPNVDIGLDRVIKG